MEFKEIFFIIWKRRVIFLFVMFSVTFLVVFWSLVQPKKYEVAFSVDVSRENYQKTDDYRYDQFYRFQADEKFADTVVRWIGAPDFYQEVKVGCQKESFSLEKLRAERLSSSYIQGSFETKNKKDAPLILASIRNELKEKNSKLNEKANDPTWFSLVIGDPAVSEKQFNLKIFVLAGLLLGFILGFFTSIFHYYWQLNENRD